MNSVGIDVSKGKSMIAVMRPFGEVVVLIRFNVNIEEYKRLTICFLQFVLPFLLYETMQTGELSLNLSTSYPVCDILK